ncbi:TPA: 1-acyl-sn-glycerol-3-phosphate acyltransferase [Candidatus Bipolaricaulota bacterium]|nr:1-acyl-sn-glycerol-3-phosphate acyltransferase [Candidatus Bipolaricaulota bacterium]HIP99813.1 1-acyl-sn-glycerol-3-phosphate acyltransferase [Candidatus Bipolaricaulota bacterium]
MRSWLADRLRDLLYALIVILATPVIWLLFRLRVRGWRNLRGTGILVARHRSYWDIPLLCIAAGPVHRIAFLARRGLLKNPLFAPLVWGFATVIDRDAFGLRDFRKALRAAKRNRLIGIFPEGTTRPGAKPKPGAIRFAELLGRPLIPVNLVPHGPYPPRPPFGFPKMEVRFGTPFPVEELSQGLPSDLPKPERYRLLAERLMERIDSV